MIYNVTTKEGNKFTVNNMFEAMDILHDEVSELILEAFKWMPELRNNRTLLVKEISNMLIRDKRIVIA